MYQGTLYCVLCVFFVINKRYQKIVYLHQIFIFNFVFILPQSPQRPPKKVLVQEREKRFKKNNIQKIYLYIRVLCI